MFKNILQLSVLTMLTFGCGIGDVYYEEAIVAEEGPLKLTQITNSEQESVYGPTISKTKNNLYWDARNKISISPSGEDLLYISTRGNAKNIFSRSTVSGSSIKQITYRDAIGEMTYSPDGEKIAYSDYSTGNADIYIMNSNGGGGMTQLTNSKYNEMSPVFSSDGKTVFYVREIKKTLSNGEVSSNFYIWGIDLESSQKTQYCEGFAPDYIKDSHALIFTRVNKKSNLGEIWTFDIESGQETLLFQDSQKGYSTPIISPDGKNICFVASSPETATKPLNTDIYIADINGTSVTQMTFHPENDVCPRWSSNGEHIFFISSRVDREKKFSIWRMNSSFN